MTSHLMSVKEAASIMGITPPAVYDLCRSGRLAHYRMGTKGGCIKISASDLEAYVAACRVEAGARHEQPEPLRHVRLPL